LRPLFATASCLLLWAALARAEPPQLRLERALGQGRAPTAAEGASFVRADQISGEVDERVALQGAAEIRRGGTVLRGDRITYTVADDEVEVTGNARVFRDGTAFFGPSATLRVDARTGAMPDAGFTYAPQHGRGTSKLIEFLEGDRVRFNEATYTTCAPGDDSWFIRASRLTLDRDDEVAIASGASVHFQGVPILASPYFQFPLGERRRSGLLTPSIGVNSRLGAEVTVPYYWNIAPNRDATITPRLMSRRGILLGTEFRYLEPTFRGTVEYDLLPNDRETGSSRDRLTLRHLYSNPSGVTGGVQYSRVSDDRYLADFSPNIVGASQLVLPQEAFIAYTQPRWSTTLRVAKNQTLQDPLAPVVKPYERVPQLSFSAASPRLAGFDAGVAFEATRFEHPSLEDGSRLVINPTLAYPLRAPGYFLVPKLQWHATWYRLDEATRTDSRPSRQLPIASIDSGLVFERAARWFGEASLQTLEPRLYYAYAPYRDQSTLPNFDSAVADFNFTQLFTENYFSGADRIGESNQLTAALVGRVLDPATGGERLRAAVGQRFYFSPQRVTLPGGTPRSGTESDILVAVRGAIARNWITDIDLEHSTQERRLVRAAASLRWQPRPGSVLSFAYRYKINEIEQVDFAAQWPIAARWYGVGRANYSTLEGRWIEVLAGVEYRDDCWAMRVVAQRFATIAQTATTSFFVQLQLNGVASIGSSPVEQLRRNIPGYQAIEPRPTAVGRYEDYE
jgi:LPS-assembly protein